MYPQLNVDLHCPHPSIIIVLGDVGTGKTVTACEIIDQYRQKGLECYMIAKSSIVVKYPKWMKSINPENIQLKPHSVIYLDDAHLYAYARDWSKGKSKILDILGRERRQTDNSVVYTTQQGRVLDVNLISMASCLIFKRPSMLQLEMERREIRKLFEEANQELEKVDYKVEYAYVLGNRFKGIVEVSKPVWFNDMISKSHGITNEQKSYKGNKVLNVFRTIGRMSR